MWHVEKGHGVSSCSELIAHIATLWHRCILISSLRFSLVFRVTILQFEVGFFLSF